MVIEMRDGLLTEFSLGSFLRFLLFMPTISSGPIDRYRRFTEDYKQIPERTELLNMLDQTVHYIMMGFLYKFILAYFIGHTLLEPLKAVALIKVDGLTYLLLELCIFMVLNYSLTLQAIPCLP